MVATTVKTTDAARNHFAASLPAYIRPIWYDGGLFFVGPRSDESDIWAVEGDRLVHVPEAEPGVYPAELFAMSAAALAAN